MINADILFDDLRINPLIVNREIHFGNSFIEVYQHTAIESIFVRSGGRWLLTVREKITSYPPQDKAFCGGIQVHPPNSGDLAITLRKCLEHPLDFMCVECDQDAGALRIHMGPSGTLPAYYTPHGDGLRIANNVCDLGGDLHLDPEIAARFLSGQVVYSHRQMYKNIYSITAGSTITYANHSIALDYPKYFKPDNISIRENISKNDALEHLDDLLVSTCAARNIDGSPVGLELSGGIDSASVAVALNRAHLHPMSATVFMADASHQACQRSAIAGIERRCLMASSQTFDASQLLGSYNLDSPCLSKGVMREFYEAPFHAMWRSFQERQAGLAYNGIGGDELCSPLTTEAGMTSRPRDWTSPLLTKSAKEAAKTPEISNTPTTLVDSSTLLAMGAYATQLAPYGLRPVSPLADPRVIAFIRSLPASFRVNKKILREYIYRVGGVRHFEKRIYEKIDFSRTLIFWILKNLTNIKSQLKYCTLSDLQIIDHDQIIKSLNELTPETSLTTFNNIALILHLEKFNRHQSST